MRILILAALTVALSSPEASARCIMSYCKDSSTASTPAPSTSWAITNTHRQKVGDLYDPGHGRRLQIRNNHRLYRARRHRDQYASAESREPGLVRRHYWRPLGEGNHGGI